MGMWAEIKAALNSTVGEKLKPLDKIIEEQAHENLYNTMASLTYTHVDEDEGIGGGVYVVPKGVAVLTDRIMSDSTNAPDVMSVILPNGLMGIDCHIADKWYNLKSIIIPNDCRYIADSAFSNLVQLQYIKWPSESKDVPYKVFSGCSSLKSIYLPEGVLYIGNQAFANCTQMRSIHLPSTMFGRLAFQAYSFDKCDVLVDVDYNGTLEQWEELQSGFKQALGTYTNGRTITIHCNDGETTITH